jgi:hypothetical protein
MLILFTIGITGFLCILNAIFAVAFRKRRKREVISYLAACLIELAIFGVALAIRLGSLTTIPYHLPPGLAFNRAEIGAALAIGIGLLPIAYWHRTSVSKIRRQIAQDAKAHSSGKGGVHVHSNAPGDWMN